MKKRLVVIVGPTASGKSAFAVALAKKIGGEIISADSRQVYRGLNLASGKITHREMRGVRHYCLDLASPKKQFSADEYKKCFWKAVQEIERRGKTPIVVGGTGFYIDIALGRMAAAHVPPNPSLRRRLAKKSAPSLFAILKKLDPARATDIARKGEKNNAFRLIRAIEIAKSSTRLSTGYPHKGETFEASKGLPFGSVGSKGYGVRWIGIRRSDAKLRRRIRARLMVRLRAGMIAEIKRLRRSGVSWKRFDELGLEPRWIARYLRGTVTKEQMLYHLENAIWRYSRRQMTWFRRNQEIRWMR